MNDLVKTGASMNRGRSKQDYCTPRDFLAAVDKRFGWPDFDLAADINNAITPGAFFDEPRDSLKQSWADISGLLFCNPPFGNVTPWAKKCAEESQRGARILLLTPASSGADWFQSYCVRYGYVLDLAPRLSFDGKNPFPKDVVLTSFQFGLVGRGFWRWK